MDQARTALKLRKATEYPLDAKDDSDLRRTEQSAGANLNRGQKKIRKSSLAWAFQTFKTA
ncbi:hypothetical protein ACQKP5_08325 [Pseudomonas vancouverensis]|uniref:hypothetical protein n=1 Tax=Pseudomonas vancouverensis TaxID=95300 RepID=UPI003D071E05